MHMYNESIAITKYCSFPPSTIIPIPKSNKTSLNISEYRQISLLSCLSKVLEKIVATRLNWFCEKSQLIAENHLHLKLEVAVQTPYCT